LRPRFLTALRTEWPPDQRERLAALLQQLSREIVPDARN
jgi:hypothetical protein